MQCRDWKTLQKSAKGKNGLEEANGNASISSITMNTSKYVLVLLIGFCISIQEAGYAQSDLDKATKALQIFSDTLNKISNTNQQQPYSPTQNAYNQRQNTPQNSVPNRGPEGSNQNVDWATKIIPDGTIFPAIIFSLQSVQNRSPMYDFINGKIYNGIEGDMASCISTRVIAKRNFENLGVRYTAEPFLKPSTYSVRGLRAGTSIILKPTLNWDFQTLRSNPQSSPTTLTTEILDENGSVIGQSQKRLMIRSANDCPILPSPQPNIIDEFLAGFVNENSPLVDLVLQYGKDSGFHNSYSGYSDPKSFWSQLFSVWFSLQKRGISYSNIASLAPPSFGGMPSQYIRFMDESVLRQQANCIDGTVLLASIYKRLGFRVAIVLLKTSNSPLPAPDHAILAVKSPLDDGSHAFIDSTVMGSAQYAGKTFQSASWDNFNISLHQAGAGMEKSRISGFTPKIIYVDDARQNGIQPIPILSHSSR